MKTSKKITLSAGFIGFSALGLSDVSADTTDNNKEKLGGGNTSNGEKERFSGLDELLKELQD